MGPPPGCEEEIWLVPAKIPSSLLSGNLSCVSKKSDTYYRRWELSKLKWVVTDILKNFIHFGLGANFCSAQRVSPGD